MMPVVYQKQLMQVALIHGLPSLKREKIPVLTLDSFITL
jgi:hypothetical protein